LTHFGINPEGGDAANKDACQATPEFKNEGFNSLLGKVDSTKYPGGLIGGTGKTQKTALNLG